MTGWQKARVWYRAIRPFTLSASVVPVVVGNALAWHYGTFRWWLFALTLLGSVLVQSGTNLIDEYADHVHGGSTGQKIQAPYKVIALGLLAPRTVFWGALTCFGVAALIGIYLVLRTGWPLALICLASLAVARSTASCRRNRVWSPCIASRRRSSYASTSGRSANARS